MAAGPLDSALARDLHALADSDRFLRKRALEAFSERCVGALGPCVCSEAHYLATPPSQAAAGRARQSSRRCAAGAARARPWCAV